MRIRIGSYWLAGDPTKTEREHSSALITFAPQRLQQGVAGLRWDSMQFFDRGNASWEIGFETSRIFADYDAVDTFILGYLSAHPFAGTVSFRMGTLSTWTEQDLKGAIIEPPVMVPQGVTLRLRYTVRGGSFVAGITSATSTGFDITQEGGGSITGEDGSHLQTEH